MAKREPLYPHVPKAKEVQFPHVKGEIAETSWIAKSVYENWKERARAYRSREEWARVLRREYWDVGITKIPREVPLSWFEVIREESRDGQLGYIVREYSP